MKRLLVLFVACSLVLAACAVLVVGAAAARLILSP